MSGGLTWIWDEGLRTEDSRLSLSKAAAVYDSARVPADEVMMARGVTVEELIRAHSLAYVTDVLGGVAPNGFGGSEPAATSHALVANGAMIQAVLEALDAPERVVCAPVSGFHHAHYAGAEGFCTFNGLMVAVANARLRRQVDKVLIIDGDAHYGNGTEDILRKLAPRGVTHLTHDGEGHVGVPLSPDVWEPQIRGLLTNQKWDLVLYQAGADAHVDDPYGAGYLSDEDWEARDRLVFRYCRQLGFPLVFNLAGGYNGNETLALHRQTVSTARAIYRSAAFVRA